MCQIVDDSRVYQYMKKVFKLFSSYIIIIISVLFFLELALEFRHYRMGYTTPFFGSKAGSESNINSSEIKIPEYGPTNYFPFRSKILKEKKETENRIWIASASHAVGGRIHVEKIFPNMICSYIDLSIPCEVVNGSRVGMNIEQNIELLKQYYERLKPNYVVLYQMSMFIGNESQRITRSKNAGINNSNPIINFEPAYILFQSFSLYTHLTDFIGHNLELEGQLKDNLPESSTDEFRRQVKLFIESSRNLGSEPVLMTFAASHDSENLNLMPMTLRTNFVKWVSIPYLSPDGWVRSVGIYNNVLREIAQENNVYLVDTERLNGQYQYFVDFVHFNEAGHKEIAKLLGDKFNKLWSR